MVGRRSGWAAAVFALVMVATGCTSSHKAKVEQGKVTVIGTALPEPGDGYTDAAGGAHAPIVTGVGFDGKPVRLAADGKPTVIILITPGPQFRPANAPAPPVDQDDIEVRGLVSLWKKKGLPAGVRVLAVSTLTHEGSVGWPPSKWFGQRHWPIPTLADDQNVTALQAFGQGGGVVLLHADGTVADRIGFSNDGWPIPIGDFNDAVRSILGLEPGYNVP